MWRLEPRLQLWKDWGAVWSQKWEWRVAESGRRRPPTKFQGSGNWRHFVRNLSRPIKLSAQDPPYIKQKHVRLSGQLTITCQRATGHPKTVAGGEKSANMVRFWRDCTSGVVDSWWGYYNLWGLLRLTVDPQLSWARFENHIYDKSWVRDLAGMEFESTPLLITF